MVSKTERGQKVIPTSKLWLSLQSGPFLRREAYSRRQKLFPPREKLQQKHRLNNSAVHSKPTSLTAEDFQQRNRDLALYGKNQFYIRFQKTGTDHTLTVSPAMIRGEPIISISALKVPLCRQRFLRNCPLYLSHTVRMEKKVSAKKEVQMTSVHGNKVLVGAVCICLVSLMILSAKILSSRKTKLQLYEKKYSNAVYALEVKKKKKKK